jgi:hypothetical protein
MQPPFFFIYAAKAEDEMDNFNPFKVNFAMGRNQ